MQNKSIRTLLILCLSSLLFITPIDAKKKYKFQLTYDYAIEQKRGGINGTKVVKSWAVAKNADKAIVKAKENAIAAAIFTGYAANPDPSIGAYQVPALCNNAEEAFYNNQDFFEDFFTGGEYLNYVHEVNSTYPSGENNVNTPKGRRVGILLVVEYSALRKRLENAQIIKSLNRLN